MIRRYRAESGGIAYWFFEAAIFAWGEVTVSSDKQERSEGCTLQLCLSPKRSKQVSQSKETKSEWGIAHLLHLVRTPPPLHLLSFLHRESGMVAGSVIR